MNGPRLSGVRITVLTGDDGKSTYEEIEPLVPLSDKVKLGRGFDDAMLARAEAAVAALTEDFPVMVAEDMALLRAAAAALRRRGTVAAAAALQRRAQDIEGQGGSFGYPLITEIAGSLWRLLEQRTVFDARLHAGVDAHLDALTLVLAERLSGPQPVMADRLGKSLAVLVGRLTASGAGP